MEKENYTKPTACIVPFENKDIITTSISGGYTDNETLVDIELKGIR